MTEQEWLACGDPTSMLEFQCQRSKASERKLRLFGVACCRRIWQFLLDERSKQAVEVAEFLADGLIPEEVVAGAAQAADEVVEDTLADTATQSNVNAAVATVHLLASRKKMLQPGKRWGHYIALHSRLRPSAVSDASEQASLIRCIFGNPFRAVGLDPAGLTSTVSQLAEAIYEEKAFDRLPILADALEDAGCSNANILNHCRQPGEHVRGCWVVDLLLGKE